MSTYWLLLWWFQDLEVWHPRGAGVLRRWRPTCPVDRWLASNRRAHWASASSRQHCARRQLSFLVGPICVSSDRRAMALCWSQPPVRHSVRFQQTKKQNEEELDIIRIKSSLNVQVASRRKKKENSRSRESGTNKSARTDRTKENRERERQIWKGEKG